MSAMSLYILNTFAKHPEPTSDIAHLYLGAMVAKACPSQHGLQQAEGTVMEVLQHPLHNFWRRNLDPCHAACDHVFRSVTLEVW